MLDRYHYKVAFFGAVASAGIALASVAAMLGANREDRPLIEPVERRTTWCPTPEQRARRLGSFLPFGEIPARGADVTRIEGGVGLDDAQLAREVNIIIGGLNPAVELRSVSMTSAGSDLFLVLGWERGNR
jgi:hypothetical protein